MRGFLCGSLVASGFLFPVAFKEFSIRWFLVMPVSGVTAREEGEALGEKALRTCFLYLLIYAKFS